MQCYDRACHVLKSNSDTSAERNHTAILPAVPWEFMTIDAAQISVYVWPFISWEKEEEDVGVFQKMLPAWGDIAIAQQRRPNMYICLIARQQNTHGRWTLSFRSQRDGEVP